MKTEFGAETFWQLVKSDGRKPWHIRCVSNFRIILYSPQYRRKIDALRAGEIAAPEWFANKTPLVVDERGQNIQPPFKASSITVTSGSEHVYIYNTGTTP